MYAAGSSAFFSRYGRQVELLRYYHPFYYQNAYYLFKCYFHIITKSVYKLSFRGMVLIVLADIVGFT